MPVTALARFDCKQCPVYFLTGEYDWSTTPAMSEATAKKIKGANFKSMEGLGHFPATEKSHALCSVFAGCNRLDTEDEGRVAVKAGNGQCIYGRYLDSAFNNAQRSNLVVFLRPLNKCITETFVCSIPAPLFCGTFADYEGAIDLGSRASLRNKCVWPCLRITRCQEERIDGRSFRTYHNHLP